MAIFMLNLLISLGILIISDRPTAFQAEIAIGITGFAMQIGAIIVALSIAFQLSLVRSTKAALPVIAATMVVVGVVFGVVRPFLIEGYQVPTHSMSPSIRGPWTSGVCPSCDGQTVIAARQEELGGDSSPFVCTSCYEADTSRLSTHNKPVAIHPADRMLANKLRAPQRWDIVVFRTAADPRVLYVKRLVGLPGETIQLHQDQLFINGAAVTPPAQAAKIRFGASPGSSPHLGLQYAVHEPLTLQANEYFMIGDNQKFALDCRYLGPVPKENLVGVVEWIYFPLARFQALP